MLDLTARTNARGVDLVGPLTDTTAARVLDVARSAVLSTPAAATVTVVGDYMAEAVVVTTDG